MLKTRRIGLIVTEEEKSWVLQLAKLDGGLSQASMIRRLIHKAANESGLKSASSSEINNQQNKSVDQILSINQTPQA
jgi:hypothetical protein